MSIKVKFFAKLREDIGIDECRVEYVHGMTVKDVWQQCTSVTPPSFLLSARNLEYVDFENSVADGDEIAFFPPVTGG